MEITVTKKVNLNQEDIDDIMCTALEGGITYWCNYAASMMVDDWMKRNKITYLSEVIGKGGDIILNTQDGNYVLTLKAFMTGLQKAIDDDYIPLEYDHGVYKIDTCEIDADIADIIIQYALFGDLVYC